MKISNRTATFCLMASFVSGAWAQTTITGNDRATADSLWTNYYRPADNPPASGWASRSTCDAGTTSVEYQAAALKRLNYFRRMAGLEDLETDATLVPAAQAAAFLMYTNKSLNHQPPSTWPCYSALGATGAARSNMGQAGALTTVLNGYFMEDRSIEPSLGHRRHLLDPAMWKTAIGDAPGSTISGTSYSAIYVIGATKRTQPTAKWGFTGWPAPGNIPAHLVPKDWSFTLAGQDFKSTQATVQVNGATVTSSAAPQFADTILFSPTAGGSDYTITVSLPGTASKQPGTLSTTYEAHVQNSGWMAAVSNGAQAGTTGKRLRMEGLRVRVSGTSGCQVAYQPHVQNFGWQPEVSNGADAGITGQSLRLEAIKIRLTNCDSQMYHIHYQAHVQDIGWQPEVSDGAMAGTTGQSKSIEAIKIRVSAVAAGGSAVTYSYKVTPYSVGVPPWDFSVWPLSNASGFPFMGQFDAVNPDPKFNPNAQGAVTYQFVSGPGDTDNSKFKMRNSIAFDGLTAQTSPATPGKYSVRVRATNAAGLTLDKVVQFP